MAAVVNAEECVGCGICVDACPADALKLEDGVAVVDEGECLDCGICAGECPNDAITA